MSPLSFNSQGHATVCSLPGEHSEITAEKGFQRKLGAEGQGPSCHHLVNPQARRGRVTNGMLVRRKAAFSTPNG